MAVTSQRGKAFKAPKSKAAQKTLLMRNKGTIDVLKTPFPNETAKMREGRMDLLMKLRGQNRVVTAAQKKTPAASKRAARLRSRPKK